MVAGGDNAMGRRGEARGRVVEISPPTNTSFFFYPGKSFNSSPGIKILEPFQTDFTKCHIMTKSQIANRRRLIILHFSHI